MSQTNWLCLVCVAAGATVLGCGGKTAGPKTAPAAGTVLLDDKPVEGATVVFAPEASGGTTVVAITDANGAFSLKTPAGADGAPPGKYKVTVTKTEAPATTSTSRATTGAERVKELEEQMRKGTLHPAQAAPPKDLIPAIYKDPQKSGLTADIPPEGKKDLKFLLKSQ
ncbi:MAG: carboxypeptidase-like regulatory domain-containing protein [Thermoguttaceae bacterium]